MVTLEDALAQVERLARRAFAENRLTNERAMRAAGAMTEAEIADELQVQRADAARWLAETLPQIRRELTADLLTP